MDSTTTGGRQRLFQRVYTLAQQEAREARARRGLPFGGLFGSAEGATVEGFLPLVAAEAGQTSASVTAP